MKSSLPPLFFISLFFILFIIAAMGQCCSSRETNSEQAIKKLRDQEIDEQLKKDRQKMSNEVKLLLLGMCVLYMSQCCL